MLTLHVATADDAAAVAELMTALNKAVGGPPGEDQVLVSADQARARLQAMAASEHVLLAFVDAAPAGLLSLRIVAYLSQDAPYAEVTELYVMPEHQRTGIGRLLMAEAEHTARGRGCTYVHVNAWHTNEGAHAFCRAVGYEPLQVGFEKRLPPKSSAKRRRAEG
ncbi:MAG: GNAT family N-acetyltransferase [Chloroflexota bacterium]|nr:GNAT family N-acetyltransferase [Chloroflexota bacterium]